MNYIAKTTFVLRRKPTTSDMMSGFFGIRTALLKKVSRERHRFVLGGYKVLLDIMRISGRGIRVSEVGYDTFSPRKAGKSKFKAKHMANTLTSVFKH
jgi:hypothetical protein